MYLSGREQRSLASCFALLAQDLNEHDIREAIGRKLLDLFEADHFASYVWDDAAGQFSRGVSLHMDPANLARYDAWYQYHDPITFALQARRHATLVDEVLPRGQLLQCEFFNDFLARDGLHWGINLHAFDGGRALGDLRIWRGRHRQEFGAHERAVLDLIEPAFAASLKRAWELRQPRAGVVEVVSAELSAVLSRRERQVVQCVARGMTDKEIARELDIALPSVRTYVQRLFEKTGVHRRSALARFADGAH